jgi:hypothetical protein
MSDHGDYDWREVHHSHECPAHGDYTCPHTRCSIRKGSPPDLHCEECIKERMGPVDLQDFDEARQMFTRPKHRCKIHGEYDCPYNVCYVQAETPAPMHCPRCFRNPVAILARPSSAPESDDHRRVAGQIGLFEEE